MSGKGKQHLPCDIGLGSPLLVMACAQCFVYVGFALPASVLSWVNRLIHCWTWVMRFGHANFFMVWAHRPGDINCGLRASISWNWLLHVRINQVTSANGRLQQPRLHVSILACVLLLDDTFVAYMHTTGDVSQRQTRTTKVYENLIWFVYILKETSQNDMKNHPRIWRHNPWSVCIIFATSTSTIRGTIIQGLCALEKKHLSMVGNIIWSLHISNITFELLKIKVA